jgi:hypothetical protein
VKFVLAGNAGHWLQKPGLHLHPIVSLLVLERILNLFLAPGAFLSTAFFDGSFAHHLGLLDEVDVDHALAADPGARWYVAQVDAFYVEGVFAAVAQDHLGLVMLLRTDFAGFLFVNQRRKDEISVDPSLHLLLHVFDYERWRFAFLFL